MTDIPNQTKWVKVFQNLATDLKAEVALAALSEIIAKQDTPGNLKALVTLAGLQGIIPNPINATRIDCSIVNVSNTTTTIYEVPAGKKLFIHSSWATVENGSASLNGVILKVTDSVGTEIFRLLYVATGVSQGNGLSNQYHPALEVPAGYLVRMTSPAASIYGHGGFSGWLESV